MAVNKKKDKFDDAIINEVAELVLNNYAYAMDVICRKSTDEVESINISIDLYKRVTDNE